MLILALKTALLGSELSLDVKIGEHCWMATTQILAHIDMIGSCIGDLSECFYALLKANPERFITPFLQMCQNTDAKHRLSAALILKLSYNSLAYPSLLRYIFADECLGLIGDESFVNCVSNLLIAGSCKRVIEDA